MILLDTNLLCRLTNSADPQCAVAREAVHRALATGEQVIVVPQNFHEFWAVATRKPGPPPVGQNGLGMTPEQASQWLRFFQRRFTFLPDHDDVVSRGHDLVRTHRITGFRSHDVRLVAAMQSNGIARLLTFNAGDFTMFPITVIAPDAV